MVYPSKCTNCNFVATDSLSMIKHRHKEHAHIRNQLITRPTNSPYANSDGTPVVSNPPKAGMTIIRPK